MRLLTFVTTACFCGVLLTSTAAFSQTEFPQLSIGQWQQHLPWQRAVSVTQSASKVYFASEWAIVEIDKADRSPNFLTKVEGLSDVGMNFVRYNQTADVLVVAYSNSNIDLWKPSENKAVNLPFIQKNVNISGDKKIYDVGFDGKFGYLACGFGIIKLNLETAEVVYTVFTELPVYSVAVYQNYLFAGTPEGIYRLPADDVNPGDFSRWRLLGPAEGFPQGHTVNALKVSQDALFMGIGNTLCRYRAATLDTIADLAPKNVVFISAEGAGLVVGWRRDQNDFSGRVQYLEQGANSPYDIQWSCETFVPFFVPSSTV